MKVRTKLVVAGNNWQFRDWVSGRKEDERPHCVEVKSLHNILGWEGVEVHFIGTWRQRRDAKKIETEILRRKEMGKILSVRYWT